VGRALTYEISRLHANDQREQISAVLRAGLLLTFLAGLVGAVVMYLIAPSLANDWLKISSQLAPDAQQAFELAAWGVLLTTVGSGLRGAQEGLEQFKIANANKAILGVATFSLPALSIYLHGSSLYFVVMYLVAARAFMLLINLYQLRGFWFIRRVPVMQTHIQSLYSFGIWVTISGIVGPLMVYGDRFFVSVAVGASLLPLYAIPQEGLQRLLLIPGSFCSALLPRLAGESALEKRSLYAKSFKHVAIIMFGVCLGSALLAYPFLAIWINPDFASQSLVIVCILVIGIWINSMALVPFTFLHANGATKLTAIFHLIELALYIFVLYYFVQIWGLVGAALAWVLRITLDLVLLQWAVKKVMRT
jgi:O-antigen/teichoic acid export membrane protein